MRYKIYVIRLRNLARRARYSNIRHLRFSNHSSAELDDATVTIRHVPIMLLGFSGVLATEPLMSLYETIGSPTTAFRRFKSIRVVRIPIAA